MTWSESCHFYISLVWFFFFFFFFFFMKHGLYINFALGYVLAIFLFFRLSFLEIHVVIFSYLLSCVPAPPCCF
jgi:hypothetical protein